MARMTIQLPDDIVRTVERIAKEQSIPKTEVIRRTFALLQIAEEEKLKGNQLGLINADHQVVARLVGV